MSNWDSRVCMSPSWEKDAGERTLSNLFTYSTSSLEQDPSAVITTDVCADDLKAEGIGR